MFTVAKTAKGYTVVNPIGETVTGAFRLKRDAKNVADQGNAKAIMRDELV